MPSLLAPNNRQTLENNEKTAPIVLRIENLLV